MLTNEIPLNKLRESLKNFKRLERREQLSVEWDRTPKYEYSRSVDTFKTELSSYTGGVSQDPTLEEKIHLIPLDTPGYKYNPNDPYYCSNVCFQTVDEMASVNTKLRAPKVNTHILCPFCDPFAEARNPARRKEKKKTTIGGHTYSLPRSAPIHSFYNTLGTKYVHHMSGCHGLKKNGQAEEPILGFVGSEMDLCIICPNVKDGVPCLSMTKFFGAKKTSETCFKGYYRHYGNCHLCNGESDLKRYSKKDLFLPLDLDDCMKATKGKAYDWLRLSTNQKVQEMISYALDHIELSENNTMNKFSSSFRTHGSYKPMSIYQERRQAVVEYLTENDFGSYEQRNHHQNALHQQMLISHQGSASANVPDLITDSPDSSSEKLPEMREYQNKAPPTTVAPSQLSFPPQNIDLLLSAVDEKSMAFPTMLQPSTGNFFEATNSQCYGLALNQEVDMLNGNYDIMDSNKETGMNEELPTDIENYLNLDAML